MKRQRTDPKDGFHDNSWQLLIELSLPHSAGLSAGDAFKRLVEAAHHLGLRPAQCERLQADLIRSIEKFTPAYPEKTGQELLIIIRLFVKNRETPGNQKDNQHPVRGSGVDGKRHVTKTEQWNQREGGWSYFLSERSLNQARTGTEPHSHMIELFLYREGK